MRNPLPAWSLFNEGPHFSHTLRRYLAKSLVRYTLLSVWSTVGFPAPANLCQHVGESVSSAISGIARDLEQPILSEELQNAASLLRNIVEPEAYVGGASLGYEQALVQIHDFYRRKVGGIPALSFLAATRVVPSQWVDVREEDASVILLRVIDHADLPNAQEALRVRVENAQRVSGELDKTWDHRDVMDPTTNNLLGYAVRCRVLGTFYVADVKDGGGKANYALFFGSDLSNYYPNRGLKVFKPRGSFLEQIVNYRDPRLGSAETNVMVSIGEVRYASTNRPFQGISGVRVAITPTDLLGQKTALFGMTRSGKSNTTKIILKSIFELRWHSSPQRVGQIVFDPNGEYANENTQDQDASKNPNALKNVWACAPQGPARRFQKGHSDLWNIGASKRSGPTLDAAELSRRCQPANRQADN